MLLLQDCQLHTSFLGDSPLIACPVIPNLAIFTVSRYDTDVKTHNKWSYYDYRNETGCGARGSAELRRWA
ncbi:MAG: hypothetical protein LBU17_05635 [Treponema sp.]|nr:hypothetical protein [Treponema sp.]